MGVDEYGPSTYGDRIAGVYDDWLSVPADTDEDVAFLAEAAAGGPVLELGIGTGRLAIPLVERGLDVRGIDCPAREVVSMLGLDRFTR